MKFIEMVEAQEEFDKNFVAHDLKGKVKKKLFALLVEQGEVANESPATFKYWSSNPKGSSQKTAELYAVLYDKEPISPKGDPLLEELVDKLHFILSIGIDLGFTTVLKAGNWFHTVEKFDDIVDLHMMFSAKVNDVYRLFVNGKPVPLTYMEMMNIFFNLVFELGYSSDDVESAYFSKNQINNVRQANGY